MRFNGSVVSHTYPCDLAVRPTSVHGDRKAEPTLIRAFNPSASTRRSPQTSLSFSCVRCSPLLQPRAHTARLWSAWERFVVRSSLIKLLSSQPPRWMRVFAKLVKSTKKGVGKKYNQTYASKICLPIRVWWRFFKSETRCSLSLSLSTISRFSPLVQLYPGCHTQAAAAELNCRESVYLSNRITGQEHGHICLSESDGPHVGLQSCMTSSYASTTDTRHQPHPPHHHPPHHRTITAAAADVDEPRLRSTFDTDSSNSISPPH